MFPSGRGKREASPSETACTRAERSGHQDRVGSGVYISEVIGKQDLGQDNYQDIVGPGVNISEVVGRQV